MDLDAVAQAWSEVWSDGRDAASLYREDAICWWVERSPLDYGFGPEAVSTAIGAFRAEVDDVELDVYRVFGSGNEMVLEAILTGVDRADGERRGTGVCAVIDLAGDGTVMREQLHLQWRGRRPVESDMRPYTPAQDGVDRGAEFWRDLTDRQLRPWGSPGADPDGMVDAVYAKDGYILDGMIAKQPSRLDGREALRVAEHRLLVQLPIRETYVARLVHGGNAAYVWHPVIARTSPTAPPRAFSSLMVLTVNAEGRVISEHTYLPAAWTGATR
jgi:hypothetical protein